MAKKDEKAEEGVVTENADGPLLDLSDAAVKKMIKAAKKRGFVTYAELATVELNSEQIEDILAMLNEMGINVVEAEEAEESEAETTAATSARRARPRPASSAPPSRPTAPTTPCGCTCARWAPSSSSRARARSRLPSASRRGARR